MNYWLSFPKYIRINFKFQEAFDVRRDAVCSALSRMRAAFRQCLSGGIQLHKEHLLHQQPQGTMGNYQDYVKNLPPPLRDPDPDAKTVKTTFGNPWKVR